MVAFRNTIRTTLWGTPFSRLIPHEFITPEPGNKLHFPSQHFFDGFAATVELAQWVEVWEGTVRELSWVGALQGLFCVDLCVSGLDIRDLVKTIGRTVPAYALLRNKKYVYF